MVHFAVRPPDRPNLAGEVNSGREPVPPPADAEQVNAELDGSIVIDTMPTDAPQQQPEVMISDHENEAEKIYSVTLSDGRAFSGTLSEIPKVCTHFKGMPPERIVGAIRMMSLGAERSARQEVAAAEQSRDTNEHQKAQTAGLQKQSGLLHKTVGLETKELRIELAGPAMERRLSKIDELSAAVIADQQRSALDQRIPSAISNEASAEIHSETLVEAKASHQSSKKKESEPPAPADRLRLKVIPRQLDFTEEASFAANLLEPPATIPVLRPVALLNEEKPQAKALLAQELEPAIPMPAIAELRLKADALIDQMAAVPPLAEISPPENWIAKVAFDQTKIEESTHTDQLNEPNVLTGYQRFSAPKDQAESEDHDMLQIVDPEPASVERPAIMPEAPTLERLVATKIQARVIEYKETAEPEELIAFQSKTVAVEMTVMELEDLLTSEAIDPQEIEMAEVVLVEVYKELLEQIGVTDQAEIQELVEKLLYDIRIQAEAVRSVNAKTRFIRDNEATHERRRQLTVTASNMKQNLAALRHKLHRRLGKVSIGQAMTARSAVY
jgi:hypothetical protein